MKNPKLSGQAIIQPEKKDFIFFDVREDGDEEIIYIETNQGEMLVKGLEHLGHDPFNEGW